ncbi:MAG: hypothetical protein K6A68_04075 [Clostridiales bacterium]|nr:hypothetical protein [Clostridiales bacterium]
MSQVWTFKCPACGNSLEYIPGTKSMKCPFCGHTSTEAEMTQETADGAPVKDGEYKEYHCQNCGAQIVTGDTTAATKCYFCHSPVVLMDRLSAEFRPDGLIPFKLDKENALSKFKHYLSKKRFLDRRFLSDDQLEMLSGVYYPYWLGEIEGDGTFEGEGTRVNSTIRGNYNITRTRYYKVSRMGHLSFSNLQRKALQEVDRKLSDGIHPFDFHDMKPFSMSFLSGFLAEKRDVEESDAAADMEKEVLGNVPVLMERNDSFQSLRGKTDFQVTDRRMRYVLLPAWILTYAGKTKDRPYYFMMNGQTGTVCGSLPLDRKKLLLTSVLFAAGVIGLLCLGGALIW